MRVINGFLKWLVFLIAALSIGLLAIIFLSSRTDLDIVWMRIIILAAVGFIGSLIGRILFHRLPGVILFLIALVTEVLAILIIDHFYELFSKNGLALSFLTREFTLQNPTPSDIAQGILLFLISLPTLFFLRRRKKSPRIQKAKKEAPAPRPKVSFQQRVRPALISINPANWKITGDISRNVQNLFAKSKKSVHTKSVQVAKHKTAAASKGKGAIKTKTKTTRKKPAAAKLSTSSKSAQPNDVKLMGEEEHICPYCLEEVHKNDSRGVVICKVCGTWHHKDCWDLTGTCGVAHRNEL